MKTALTFTKEELQHAIDEVEANGPLKNRASLWIAVCNTEWSRNLKPRRLTTQVAYLRFKELGATCKTPPGKKGFTTNCKVVKNKKLPSQDIVDAISSESSTTLEGTTAKFKRGSLKAAIKLKCLDCSCQQRKEITNCPIKRCPLWHVRPYQNS